MRTIFRIVIVLLVLIAGTAVAIYFSLDGIVRSTVQSQTAEELKVQTTLSSVSLNLFNGKVGLNQFSLGSPAGFSAPQMLTVGSLNVDTGGLLKLRNDPIHILTIDIDSARLVVEQKGSKFNFKELAEKLPSNPDKSPSQSTGTTGKPIRVIIDTLTITNAHVLLQEDIIGIKKQIDLALPTTTIKDIGNSDGLQKGVQLKDVATAILSQMVNQASKSAGVPIDVQALLGGNLGSIKDKLTGAAKGKIDGLNLPGDVNDLLKSIGGH